MVVPVSIFHKGGLCRLQKSVIQSCRSVEASICGLYVPALWEVPFLQKLHRDSRHMEKQNTYSCIHGKMTEYWISEIDYNYSTMHSCWSCLPEGPLVQLHTRANIWVTARSGNPHNNHLPEILNPPGNDHISPYLMSLLSRWFFPNFPFGDTTHRGLWLSWSCVVGGLLGCPSCWWCGVRACDS